MKEKELYGRMKHNIIPAKSKKYITWLKEREPHKEPHHIIGSQGALKLSDYLIVMVSRSEHNKAEAFRIKFFFENIHIAINNLIEYARHLENS